jgi:hypothetical protein
MTQRRRRREKFNAENPSTGRPEASTRSVVPARAIPLGRQTLTMKKFHLRVAGLQLCCLHELAAIPTVGSDFNGSLDFHLAEFRKQKARMRVRHRLCAFPSSKKD